MNEGTMFITGVLALIPLILLIVIVSKLSKIAKYLFAILYLLRKTYEHQGGKIEEKDNKVMWKG